ncbi:twin-arginine translocation signal domain-containing protein [Plantactinospora sp. WMMB334]|uniref:twin-arginine translocation signal domain-containing protein n=1 Tax=Plantactinospora sp. WMMB334 TaxID=3404119 RepID=UPI003B958C02
MIEISRRNLLRGVAVTTAAVALTSGYAVAAYATSPPARPAPAGPAAPGGACTMRTLPVPADTYRSDVTAMDPSGRFVLGSAIVRQATDTHPVLLWDRGRLTSFDPPVPGGSPVDVNRHGVAVGNGPRDVLSPPWRYRAGRGELLPVLDPADDTTVVAVNSGGDIVGMGLTPTNRRYGLLWPAGRPGTVRVIDTPSPYSTITGLTDDGTVVGRTDGIETTSWLRTPAGVLRPLTGPDGEAWVTVRAASGRWAVGQGLQGGANAGLRWNLRTGRYTVLDPQLGYDQTDVNGRGTVLGGSLIQRGDTVLTLPSPAPDHVVGGRAIADNGTVAGFHNPRVPDGVRAVLWTGC